MAKVLLLSAAPENDPERLYTRHCYQQLRQCVEKDVVKAHSLTDDPRDADLIIFAETQGAGTFFEQVRKHPFVKDYREKCFLFSDQDQVIPFLPGVYTSIEKRWYCSRRVRSGHYLRTVHRPLPFEADVTVQPYLFSFVGSVETARVRKRLAALRHPRGYFQDTTRAKSEVKGPRDDSHWYRRQFIEACQRSKFILCPRGKGVSSMRLFESMEMGRAPVVISDQGVLPDGPEWEKFSLRVAEKEVSCIPRLLEEYEASAATMGLLARSAWEEWFSAEVSFYRIVEWCLNIKRSRKVPEHIAQYAPYGQLFRPRLFKRLIKSRLRILVGMS